MQDDTLKTEKNQLQTSETQLQSLENTTGLQQKEQQEIVPVASTLKKLNDGLLEVFDRIKKEKNYKLMPRFSDSVIKILEFQAKLMGKIQPEQHHNIYNINLIKQEIVKNVDRLLDEGAIDLRKVNTKEFIDGVDGDKIVEG